MIKLIIYQSQKFYRTNTDNLLAFGLWTLDFDIIKL